MKIAIVEDNELHQKVILENLRSIDYEKCYEILVFNDASSFLFEFEDTTFDALLLDIEMPDMNGVELAAKVRSIDADIPIAFITGEKDYVFEGYMVEAIGYLLKPVESKSLQDLMKRIERKTVVREPVVLIKNQDGIESVKQSAILYIESNDHKTEVVTAVKVYSSNKKLYEWEQRLDPNVFQKIHRCTLVNLNHIQKILKKECHVDNGKVLAIARGQWEPLMQAYLRNQRGKHI